MAFVLLIAQINWASFSRALFGGIEALAILVLLILLIVGWAKGVAGGAKGPVS